VGIQWAKGRRKVNETHAIPTIAGGVTGLRERKAHEAGIIGKGRLGYEINGNCFAGTANLASAGATG